jgi:molybdopterin converting factor subunit 1
MSPSRSEIDVEVLFFARARELAGTQRATLRLEAPATVESAAREVAARFPRLGGLLAVCRFAVDEAFASSGEAVQAGAVLAVIPPVSGGA